MTPAFRILYAEDNPLDVDLTLSHFSEHAPDFEIEVVPTGQACIKRLTRIPHDLVLLDHRLPDMEGLDVLRALLRARCPVPVVLVTGSGDEDLVVKALRLGAATYVPKVGNYLDTLPALLRSVIEEHRFRQRQGLLVGSEALRILYVEHNSMDIELTLQHFADMAPGHQLEVLRTCAEALARLAEPPTLDAVLIDLRMPDQSGLDFVREVQRRRLALPPFIVISGKGDEAAAIASLRLGASDYVVKRQGYLDLLTYVVDRAIAHDRLNRLHAKLREELSERRRAEEALTFQNVILSTQQETSRDGILVVDDRGRVLSYNRRFVEMWGVSSDLLSPGVPEGVLKARMEGMLDPQRCHLGTGYSALPGVDQEEIVLKDGRSIERYSAAMTSTEGTCLGQVWYFRDITSRKRNDAERERLEQQLRVSQKMEAIGSLAGGVAHDFNNLLSVILNHAGFALEACQQDDPLKEDLLEIRKAAERAAGLTWQLLAFSRKQVLQPVTLDLNQIALGMEKMLRRILGEDVEFVQTLAPDLGSVRADRGQVEQVLMNLVVNARDAMPDGGTLTITTCNVEIDARYVTFHVGSKPGPYVQLTVTDTGLGMDEATKARIFEPFFTTKPQGRGTGFGLSTVYGIVKQSGGGIWVYSEPGLGTTFKIYLPRDVSASTAADKSSLLSTTRAAGTETLLVVEDEEPLRKVARRILEGAGYTVLVAPDGEQALLVSERHPGEIHLLVTDVVMPRMSGTVLAERLTQIRPTLRVLYISGYTDDAIVRRGLLQASTHFLGKPFTALDLTGKVREVLDGRPSGVAPGDERPSELPSAEPMQQPFGNDELRAVPRETHPRMKRSGFDTSQPERMTAEQLRVATSSQLSTILALAEFAEARDADSDRHIERVQTLTRELALRMREAGATQAHRLTPEFIENLHQISALHDIGKVAIPDAVLLKPGKLSAEDFDEMKKHCVLGSEALAAVLKRHPQSSFLHMGVEVARSHHERWDGTGYPDGLEGAGIPLAARIVGVADVYDALTSRRCYRPAFTEQDATRMIQEDSGTHFDPEVVAAFETLRAGWLSTRERVGSGPL